MLNAPWIRPRSASSVCAWVIALRKVLSTQLSAPPSASAASAAHRRVASPSATTVIPHPAAAAAISAPCRAARVNVPDSRPASTTPAG
ncbi:hypothetical protein Sru01_30150 [Sphaerisporangium rufum]|uniref:Uncharacterized protein n=2 Tax=Sphaerisporangium rufum TaxID=1381558 RepID=A0A919R2B2_9ACTN|nr:hypothetical protein Sru01_30150 [Sphaerisporangium rufum]